MGITDLYRSSVAAGIGGDGAFFVYRRSKCNIPNEVEYNA